MPKENVYCEQPRNDGLNGVAIVRWGPCGNEVGLSTNVTYTDDGVSIRTDIGPEMLLDRAGLTRLIRVLKDARRRAFDCY